MNNILLSTDFSNAANNALATAISICQQHKSKLTLLHVIDDSRIHFSGAGNIIFGPVPELVRIASDNLSRLARTLSEDHGIEVRFHVLTGKAPHAICQFAVQRKMDLIVIAKRGEFNEASLSLGDIASTVVRLSSVPVLCVPFGRQYKGFNKILFPLQESVPVMTQYKVAKSVSKKPSFVVAGIGKKSTLNITPSRLIRLAELLVRKIRSEGMRSTKIINVCDDVSSELVSISNEEDTDLICISTPAAKSVVARKNNFAFEVLEKSSCPVLTLNEELMMQVT